LQLTGLDVEKILGLAVLNTLDLSNNSLAQLPPKLALLKELRSLQVQGNTFRVPRRDLIDKGTAAVLAYLRDKIPQ
jgi:hypothetical protein